MTVGVLLLAAGSSRRFGSDKRRAVLGDGRTLLQTVIDSIRASGLPLRVCLSAEDDALAGELGKHGIATIRCTRASEGMGGTLGEGAAALPPWDAVLVALADMPVIRPETYARVAAHAERGGICVPFTGGAQGHPVAFGAEFLGELARCRQDRGARWVIDQHQAAVRRLDLDDPGILLDIDSQEALLALNDA
jgi:molybdenum cofactor cytidylyltransferase